MPLYYSTSSGSSGASLPTGGAAAQVLTKNTASDGDASWLDSPATWPVLVANLSNQAVGANAFTTLVLTGKVTDSHNGLNTSTGIYTIPQAGTYDITAKMRLGDNSGAVNYGLGCDITNGDSSSFVWTSFPTNASQNRQTHINSKTQTFAAGAQVRIFCYLDSASKTVTLAELNIVRIR